MNFVTSGGLLLLRRTIAAHHRFADSDTPRTGATPIPIYASGTGIDGAGGAVSC